MYSKTVMLNNESQELFEALHAEYIQEFQPVGARELHLVDDIVIARWRLNRIVTMETAAIDHEIDRQRVRLKGQAEVLDEATRASLAFGALADESRSLSLLNRYEGRLLRTIRTSTEMLERLQEKRLAKTEKCENEPEAPGQSAE